MRTPNTIAHTLFENEIPIGGLYGLDENFQIGMLYNSIVNSEYERDLFEYKMSESYGNLVGLSRTLEKFNRHDDKDTSQLYNYFVKGKWRKFALTFEGNASFPCNTRFYFDRSHSKNTEYLKIQYQLKPHIDNLQEISFRYSRSRRGESNNVSFQWNNEQEPIEFEVPSPQYKYLQENGYWPFKLDPIYIAALSLVRML